MARIEAFKISLNFYNTADDSTTKSRTYSGNSSNIYVTCHLHMHAHTKIKKIQFPQVHKHIPSATSICCITWKVMLKYNSVLKRQDLCTSL